MTGIRWESLATVAGGGVIALVCLVGAALGHPWSVVPGVLGLLIAVREVRRLRRLRSGKLSQDQHAAGRRGHVAAGPSSRRPGTTR